MEGEAQAPAWQVTVRPGQATATNLDVVRRLLATLRAEDHEATAALLHPEIQARGRKGWFSGVGEVVRWARPSTDGQLVSRVEVDELREVGERHVAVDARRQWRWREQDEVADESPFGVLFELRDGLVYRWRQDFDSIIDAIDAIAAE